MPGRLGEYAIAARTFDKADERRVERADQRFLRR